MKVGILSDIHVDKNYVEGDRVEDAMIKTIKNQAIDVLIIAGDISNNYKKTLDVLNELQTKSSAKIIFVPGNHDIWSKKTEEKDTLEIYEKLKAFEGNLSRENIVINDWAFVGDIGWYDYSFGSKEYHKEDFFDGKAFGRRWQDKKYVNWGMNDIEVTNNIYKRIKERLDLVKDKNIILVTHMLINEAFTVGEDHEKFQLWKYFNAFLGSNRFFELAEEYKVKYAIMGHVHYRKHQRINDIELICNCLNYRNEWKYNGDALKEVENSMYAINI